MGLDLGVLMS